MPFTSLLWLLVVLGPLLVLERWVHNHLQRLILLLVRSPEVTLLLYSLIFLPGVLVHEASHWLMATLLGVRTGGFSVWPERRRDGTLRLGYVETARVDFVREGLIGVAPLIAGAAVISFAAYNRLGAGPVGLAVASGNLAGVLEGLWATTQMPDAWLWTYLIFTVSNAMLPSRSDRRAWPFIALGVAVVIVILTYAGFGAALAENLAHPLGIVLRALAGAFSITVFLNLLIIAPIYLTELAVMRLTGLRIVEG